MPVQYIIFGIQQMIDVANGATAQGVTGLGLGYGTSVATYQGEAEALSYFAGIGGLDFQFINGWGPMREYYFLGTPISEAIGTIQQTQAAVTTIQTLTANINDELTYLTGLIPNYQAPKLAHSNSETKISKKTITSKDIKNDPDILDTFISIQTMLTNSQNSLSDITSTRDDINSLVVSLESLPTSSIVSLLPLLQNLTVLVEQTTLNITNATQTISDATALWESFPTVAEDAATVVAHIEDLITGIQTSTTNIKDTTATFLEATTNLVSSH